MSDKLKLYLHVQIYSIKKKLKKKVFCYLVYYILDKYKIQNKLRKNFNFHKKIK
jgi:hypothetical protein